MKYKALILLPMFIGAGAALVYAFLFKTDTWSAKQSLVIRDDLVGESYRPGRFESLDSMKVAQDSILEVARKPKVIRAALEKLGPPPSIFGASANWPSAETIEDTQGTISISAPNGNELGTTEMFLLSTKANSPERVRKFNELLLAEVETKVREVRQNKFESIADELKNNVKVAQASFDEAAQLLQELEKEIGADLSYIRILNDEQSGEGSLDRELSQISIEKRAAEIAYERQVKLNELLARALKQPEKFTATSELLESQPRLKNLVAGLGVAQLKLATLVGEYTERHPKVITGRKEVSQIQNQIYIEINSAIQAVDAKIEMAKANLELLTKNEAEMESRLKNLAAMRVDYDKLERDATEKATILGSARAELAQVLSASAHGVEVDLLDPVDAPQVSTSPDGPSKKAIVGAGALAGLMVGFGLTLLVMPGQPAIPVASNFSNIPTAAPAKHPVETPAVAPAAPTPPMAKVPPENPVPDTSVPPSQYASAGINPVVTRPVSVPSEKQFDENQARLAAEENAAMEQKLERQLKLQQEQEKKKSKLLAQKQALQGQLQSQQTQIAQQQAEQKKLEEQLAYQMQLRKRQKQLVQKQIEDQKRQQLELEKQKQVQREKQAQQKAQLDAIQRQSAPTESGPLGAASTSAKPVAAPTTHQVPPTPARRTEATTASFGAKPNQPNNDRPVDLIRRANVTTNQAQPPQGDDSVARELKSRQSAPTTPVVRSGDKTIQVQVTSTTSTTHQPVEPVTGNQTNPPGVNHPATPAGANVPRHQAPTEPAAPESGSSPKRAPDRTLQIPPQTIDEEFSKFFNENPKTDI